MSECYLYYWIVFILQTCSLVCGRLPSCWIFSFSFGIQYWLHCHAFYRNGFNAFKYGDKWPMISIPSFFKYSGFYSRCPAPPCQCHSSLRHMYYVPCRSHNYSGDFSLEPGGCVGSSVCVLSFYNFLSFYISNTVTIPSVLSFFISFLCLFAFSLLVGAGNTADVSCDNTLLTRLTILTGLCQHIQFINMAQTPPSCSDAFFWARRGQHGDHST